MPTGCRNCGSNRCHSLATAVVAPFFMKRVFGINIPNLAEVLRVQNQSKLIDKIEEYNLNALLGYQGPALASVRVCEQCGFIGPELDYPPEILQRLYVDYRSDSYNEERCRYEPQYRVIQDVVGKDPIERSVRLTNLEQLLKSEIKLDEIYTVLDWGGGEGLFIPPCLEEKAVSILDISDAPMANESFTRISEPSLNEFFDLILLAHVIEHVSSPLEFVTKVLFSLKPGGFLYIEVPQDRPNEDIERFKFFPESINHYIHEHLNVYCESSLLHLGEALGIREVRIKKSDVDFGWTKGTHLAGLFQKPI